MVPGEQMIVAAVTQGARRVADRRRRPREVELRHVGRRIGEREDLRRRQGHRAIDRVFQQGLGAEEQAFARRGAQHRVELRLADPDRCRFRRGPDDGDRNERLHRRRRLHPVEPPVVRIERQPQVVRRAALEAGGCKMHGRGDHAAGVLAQPRHLVGGQRGVVELDVVDRSNATEADEINAVAYAAHVEPTAVRELRPGAATGRGIPPVEEEGNRAGGGIVASGHVDPFVHRLPQRHAGGGGDAAEVVAVGAVAPAHHQFQRCFARPVVLPHLHLPAETGEIRAVGRRHLLGNHVFPGRQTLGLQPERETKTMGLEGIAGREQPGGDTFRFPPTQLNPVAVHTRRPRGRAGDLVGFQGVAMAAGIRVDGAGAVEPPMRHQRTGEVPRQRVRKQSPGVLHQVDGVAGPERPVVELDFIDGRHPGENDEIRIVDHRADDEGAAVAAGCASYPLAGTLDAVDVEQQPPRRRVVPSRHVVPGARVGMQGQLHRRRHLAMEIGRGAVGATHHQHQGCQSRAVVRARLHLPREAGEPGTRRTRNHLLADQTLPRGQVGRAHPERETEAVGLDLVAIDGQPGGHARGGVPFEAGRGATDALRRLRGRGRDVVPERCGTPPRLGERRRGFVQPPMPEQPRLAATHPQEGVHLPIGKRSVVDPQVVEASQRRIGHRVRSVADGPHAQADTAGVWRAR